MGSPRDEEEDKDTTEPPHTEDAQTDSMLPPRVVVQLPDGGVQIGEDSRRLQHEQQQQPTSNRPGASASNNRPGAQPGTEQWLELRRLLYATALEAIALKRKRISSLLVAIDLLYMLMNLAAVIFTQRSKEGHWMQPMDAVVAILGAALDGITMVAVVREHRRAVRAMAVLHICLMIPVTLNGLVPLAIIRLLVASFLARLVACLVELDWVLTGQPLTRKPSPAWLQGGLLGVQLCGLRHDYLNALETMDRQRAARGESASSEAGFSGVVLWTGPGAGHPDDATAPDAIQGGAPVAESNSSAGQGGAPEEAPEEEGATQHASPAEVPVGQSTSAVQDDAAAAPVQSRAVCSGDPLERLPPANGGPQRLAEGVEPSPLGPSEGTAGPATADMEPGDAGRCSAVSETGTSGTSGASGMGVHRAPASRPTSASLRTASSTDLAAG